MTINKRLDDLENRTGGKRGHAVLYCDPDHPGEYTERNPWSKDPGKRIGEAEKLDMADRCDLLIIEYVRDWPYGEARQGMKGLLS